jgi:hypothetical protein
MATAKVIGLLPEHQRENTTQKEHEEEQLHL